MSAILRRTAGSRKIVWFVALLAFGTSPSQASAQAEPTSCTIVSQNLFVRDVLNDLYLWYRELPDVDPAAFPSPEAYLEAVRYRPLDRTFSYITSRQSNDAFFNDSQFIGLGLSTTVVGRELRVLQVFPGSPAAWAGLARGHRIVAINGRRVADLIASGEIAGAFGGDDFGRAVSVVFREASGRERRATMTKRLVTIPTVSVVRVLEVDGRSVGYLFFRNFVQPSYAALDEAFSALREAGVRELVLDLRYNGGGLVDVAVHLASLIGGALTDGQVFAEFAHNDKNAHRNETLRFRNPPRALGLSRLVVVTTRGSASASELVINSLRPYIPVVIIGDTTFGKPVGQYGIPFCDKVAAPVAFSLRNVRGEADYFDGLAPTCPAPDDVDHQLGDAREASLGEALHFIREGTCSRSASSLRAKGRLAVREPAPQMTGWQSIVNAY